MSARGQSEAGPVLTSDDIGSDISEFEVTVSRVIFSKGNFFIFACREGFSVKGNSDSEVCAGLSYKVSGRVTSYQGQPQLSATSIVLIKGEETDIKRIASFLRDTFDGVGEKLAETLAQNFGGKVLDELMSDPQKVASQTTGLTSKKALKFSREIEENKGILETLLYLRKEGLSKTQAEHVYDAFGEDSKKKVEDNPFCLLRIPGIAFGVCDEIYSKYHDEVLDLKRFSGAVYESVKQLSAQSGNTYFKRDKIKASSVSILFNGKMADITPEQLDSSFDEAAKGAADDKFITIYKFSDNKCMGCDIEDPDARIALREYFGTEAAIKKEIEAFLEAKVKMPDENETLKLIRRMGNDRGITLNELQEQAIYISMFSPIAIITGGPGTGKTTITSILASHFKTEGISFEFCAPTGRAAKRLSEASGVHASTIHRLLEMSASDDDEGEEGVLFGRNRSNPLEARVIVADEASMIDMFLFKALLDAMRPGASLILVGDPDQLPSVGAGNILSDLLSCSSIPCVKLEHIFRQEDEGLIASNATRILNGQMPLTGPDFEIISTNSDSEALPVITDISKKRSDSDVAILCPTRRGILGTELLNITLQKEHNTDGEPMRVREGLELYKGDIVMQIRNNYSIEYYDPTEGSVARGVFNGELGTVGDFDILTAKTDIIFDGDRRIGYDKKLLSDIELAYAVTVHKAQGCEFDCVVIVLGMMNMMLSNRRILYTAVTRGRKKVILINSGNRLEKMLSSSGDFKRDTSLGDFLKIVEGRHPA